MKILPDHTRLLPDPRDPRHVLAVAAVTGAIVALLGACSAQQIRERSAEGTYLGQELKCVNEARSLVESRMCREAVDRRWHIFDAGADAPSNPSKDAADE